MGSLGLRLGAALQLNLAGQTGGCRLGGSGSGGPSRALSGRSRTPENLNRWKGLESGGEATRWRDH